MFPFESRWRWLFSTGYLHIVEAIREHIDRFEAPFDSILKDRAERTERVLRVRLAVLVLLNIGLIATSLAWIAHVAPILETLESAISMIAGSLTGLSLALTGLYLLLSRYLGQLQADMISSMALGTPGSLALTPDQLDRLEDLEEEAQRRGWFPGRGGGSASKDS